MSDLYKPTEEELKDFFLEAMREGWANKPPKQRTPLLPGYKIIPYTKGALTLTDCYLTTPYSDWSFGSTTITYNGQPVWWMRYGGSYPEEAIAFLQESLNLTYSAGLWVAGRGPTIHISDDWIYFNNVADDSFSSPAGNEEIVSVKKKRKVGYHEYWGKLLI